MCTGSDKDQQPAAAKEEEEDDDDEVDDDDEGDRSGKVSELESKFQEELAQESGAAQTGGGSVPLPGSGSKKRSKAEVEEERLKQAQQGGGSMAEMMKQGLAGASPARQASVAGAEHSHA